MTKITTPEAFNHHLQKIKPYHGAVIQYQILPAQVSFFSDLFNQRQRQYASTKQFDVLANLQGGLGEIAWGLYLCS